MKEEVPMKKCLFVMAGLLMFSSMVATQVARAQEPMLVNIPFAFVAGNASLPAGEYRVQKLEGNSAVVLIRCSDASASAMVITNAAQANERQSGSNVEFHHSAKRSIICELEPEALNRGSLLPHKLAQQDIVPHPR